MSSVHTFVWLFKLIVFLLPTSIINASLGLCRRFLFYLHESLSITLLNRYFSYNYFYSIMFCLHIKMPSLAFKENNDHILTRKSVFWHIKKSFLGCIEGDHSIYNLKRKQFHSKYLMFGGFCVTTLNKSLTIMR